MKRKYIYFKVVFALVFISVQSKSLGYDNRNGGLSSAKYFENLQNNAQLLASSDDDIESTDELEDTHNFEKRNKSPPSGFEDIERNYLISQCTKFLKEFIGIAEKANNDTETRAQLQQVLQDEIIKLNHMNVTQLKQYMTGIHHAVQHGHHGNLVITGHSDSVSQVSEWIGNIIGG